jgi:hypothetical protein
MTHFQAQKSQSIARRLWTTSMAVVAGACLALQPPELSAHELDPPPVPPELKVPAGHRPFLLGHASGTQNYICLAKKTDSGFAWTLFGPQATLFNDDDMQIITHFLSPNPEEEGTARATWQHSRDTSTVWAKRSASSSDPAVVEPGAIPWLLLEVVGADLGPSGGHRLTETTHIQRVHTSGGLEPLTGCAQASDIGQQALVPYTADYIFYKATGRE